MLYPLSYGSETASDLHAAAQQATESPRLEPQTFTGSATAWAALLSWRGSTRSP